MSALTHNAGFRLTTLVEAQRGMTDAEVDQFLRTGESPDLSRSPTTPNVGDDEIIYTDAEAEALLTNLLIASAVDDNFFVQVEPHSETVVFKFNKNQPRDSDGKWTDGLGSGRVDVTTPNSSSQLKSGSSAGSSTTDGSGKKAIPAVIYKKHADGTVVATSADGQRRMRWAAGPKKFVIEERTQATSFTPPATKTRKPTASWPFSYNVESSVQENFGDLARMSDDEYKAAGYHLMKLPVSALVPTQEDDGMEWGDADEYGAAGKPFVVDLAGELYLIDGHHRAVKAGPYGQLEAWVRPVEISQGDTDSWQETAQLNKTSAYNDLKNPDKWFEPGQQVDDPQVDTQLLSDVTVAPQANLSPSEMTVDQWREALGANADHPTGGLGVTEDLTLKRMAQIAGFDKPAQYGNINTGGEIGYRGVSDPAFMDQLVNGDYFGSIGQYGNGTYFASKRDSVNVKHAAGVNGAVFGAALSPDAKTITLDELEDQMESDTSGLPELLAHDPGRYAIANGYDAYFVQKPGKPWRNMIVLNRSKLTIEQPGQNDQNGAKRESSISSQTPESKPPVVVPEADTRTQDATATQAPKVDATIAGQPSDKNYATGKNIIDQYDAKSINKLVFAGIGKKHDTVLTDIAKRQGFDAKPREVSVAELDEIIANGAAPLYRGISDSSTINPDGSISTVSAADLADQFIDGDAFFGMGNYGSGIYTINDPDTAADYGDVVEKMALDPNARVITNEELSALRPTIDFPDALTETHLSDAGRLAAALGYDALYFPSMKMHVVFNRGAIIASRTNRDSPEQTTAKLDSPTNVELTTKTPTQSGTSSTYTGPSVQIPTSLDQAVIDEYIALAARQTQYDNDVKNRWDGESTIPEPSAEERMRLYNLGVEIGKQSDSTIRFRVEQQGAIEGSLNAWREEHGITNITPDELKAQMANETRQAFAGKKIGVRVDDVTLIRVLQDGRFKTQFESGASKGYNNPQFRAKFEAQWFGIGQGLELSDAAKVEPEKRPLYGYVMLDGVRPAEKTYKDVLSWYGTTQIVLKDRVRNRTTAMFGDSINDNKAGMPSPIDNPTWESFTPMSKTVASENNHALTRRDRSDPDVLRSHTYAEAQIHGGVSVDDIEEVILSTQPTEQMRTLLAESGVQWRVLESSE